ncbi:MAG TPA: sensor histidine kinase [Bacteroidota bacterium]|nr:sensor histidine kinase [Bacteroidota bacterium]
MKKRDILRTFLFCMIVTVIIAASFIYSEPSRWLGELVGTFIFSMCIGFSIHFLSTIFWHRMDRFPKTIRYAALLFLFLTGGMIGTELGAAIQFFVFDVHMNAEQHKHLILMNLVLAAIFGTIAVTYFGLKANVERMARQLREKELNEERLTRTKMEAELQALQAKINPHFLFNTLNSIASLISENPKAAESTVEKLSELFRYTLKNAEKNTVTLAEELSIVKTYLEIEKVRFGDRLQFELKCDPSVEGLNIPALIVQPLVENGVKHGIGPKVGGGTIRIEATQTDGQCCISVVDDGDGLKETGNKNGFGLRSIEERLRLRYGDAASLRIVPGSGTHFLITIPIL